VIQEVLRIGEVALITEAADIGDVRFNRGGIVVRTDEHSKAGLLQSEAEAARAAEEVDGREAKVRLGPHPTSHGSKVERVGGIGGRGEPQLVSAIGLHRNTALLSRTLFSSLCGHHHLAP
jgi:hypothetical protein